MAGKGNDRSFFQQCTTCENLLEDPCFSDITVYVGEKEKEYKLHRNILSVGSSYFKVVCKEGAFREGNERVVKIPDTDSDAFDIILKWLYSGEYSLPEEKVDRDAFCLVLKAADYFGISALKEEMLQQAGDRVKAEDAIPAVSSSEDKDKHTINDPVELFYGIAQSSSLSEWPILREFVDKMIPTWSLEEGSLFDVANSKRDDSLASAVIIDRYQDILNENFCDRCTLKLQENPKKQCKTCMRSLVYERRAGPPRQS
ncbi:hypothetical protein ABW20_dc0106917 [Dactylellina cionopaga]|nr:hypothetical protein ABW20_dc0106917 [Dactylellina cionopaga]